MNEESSISYLTLVLARKYAKNYVDQEVGKILSFKIKIVETLPADPDTHTIYLVPKSRKAENNGYYEYLYIEGKQELIGDTEIDLSDYYKKHEVDQLIEDNKYILPAATATTLGGVMIDMSSLKVDENGVISLDEENVARIATEQAFQPVSQSNIEDLFN